MIACRKIVLRSRRGFAAVASATVWAAVGCAMDLTVRPSWVGAQCAPASATVERCATLDAVDAVAGDFDGDGQLDVALATIGSAAGTLQVFLGMTVPLAPSGTPITLSLPGQPRRMLADDFDSDGTTDIAVSDSLRRSVDLYRGLGNGAFVAWVQLPLDRSPGAMTSGDFNADGWRDLAVVGDGCPTASIVTFTSRSGGLAQGSDVARHNADCNTSDLVYGRFDHDPYGDLISCSPAASSLRVFRGTAAGGFVAGAAMSARPGVRRLARADLDSDGLLDLVLANTGVVPGVTVYFNATFPGYGPAFLYAEPVGPAAFDVGVHDIEGDGDLEIVAGVAGALDFFELATWPPYLARVGAMKMPGTFLTIAPVAPSDFTLGSVAIAPATGQIVTMTPGCQDAPSPIGPPGWPQDGKSLTSGPAAPASGLRVGFGADAALVAAWVETDASGSSVRMQKLDRDGRFLWGSSGHTVPSGVPLALVGFAPSGVGGASIALRSLQRPEVGVLEVGAEGRVRASRRYPGCSSLTQVHEAHLTPDGAGGCYLTLRDSWGEEHRVTTTRMTSSLVSSPMAVEVLIATAGPDGHGRGEIHDAFASPSAEGGLWVAVHDSYGRNHPYPYSEQRAILRRVRPDGTLDVYGIHFDRVMAAPMLSDAQSGVYAHLWDYASSTIGIHRHFDDGSRLGPHVVTNDIRHGTLRSVRDVDHVVLAWLTASGETLRVERRDFDGVFDPAGYSLALALGGPAAGIDLAGDGAGRIVIVWQEPTGRVRGFIASAATGVPLPGWSAAGSVICEVPANRSRLGVVMAESGVALATWLDDRDGTTRPYVARLGPDGVVATHVSLESSRAEADHVRLSWIVHGSIAAAVVERSSGDEWNAVDVVPITGDGRIVYVDHDVTPGRRYGYRLRVGEDSPIVGGEAWLDIPAPRLALAGFLPNPARGSATIGFTLPTRGDAELALFDIAGRRVRSERWEAEAGAGRVQFGRLPPGIYLIRLQQASHVVWGRGLVLQ